MAQDADGDGLPDADEAGQGLDEGVADAALFATIDYPSNGASLQVAPITLGGRRSSPEVDVVLISTDGGATYAHTATLASAKSLPYAQNTWSYAWTPPAPGAYSLVVRAVNTFGGFTTSAPITLNFQPSRPLAVISAPVRGERLQGTVAVTGSALEATDFGLSGWTLHRHAGDVAADTPSGWISIASGANEVNSVSFGSLDTAAVSDGAYTLRLIVTDSSGYVKSTTTTVIEVDNSDVAAPAAPSGLTITGQLDPNFVANSGTVNVTGTAEPGASVSSAVVVDVVSKAILKDVSSDITIHMNGSIRGSFVLPGNLTASRVALQLSVRDAVGNVSSAASSNPLTVDNDGPGVAINFPLASATLPRSLIIVTGTANDGSGGGVASIAFSSDGANFSPATGTTAWSYNWTPSADQPYTLTVRATDALGNTGETQVSVTVNNSYPSAYITSPSQGAEVNEGAVVSIVGTASDTSDFDFYSLRYVRGVSPASGYVDITPGQVTTPVVNGTLASWDTTGLDEGLHTLRLFVFDQTGNFVRFDSLVMIRARLSIVGIPGATLAEDGSIADFVHLPDYTSALVGDPETFTYSIVSNTNSASGVTLDGSNNIDIAPTANWNGFADVTVQVDNGERTDTDVFRVTVTPQPDAPTQPVVSISPDPATTGNDLTCTVTTPSTDADGDTVLYTYSWYVSTDNFATPRAIADRIAQTSHTLPASSTSPGQTWKCIVTPWDGGQTGPATQDSVLILNATTITAPNLDAATRRLGVPILAQTTVTPSSNRTVRFEYRVPGAGAPSGFVNATNTSGSTYEATLYLPSVGAWEVYSEVDANVSAEGKTSSAVNVTISKAKTMIILNAAQSAVKPGESFELFGVLGTMPPLPGALASAHLPGRTIQLEYTWSGIAEPLANTSVLNSAGQFEQVYTPDAARLGQWTMRARFQGNVNLEATDWSQALTLRVQQTAGYALLVVGQIQGSEGLGDHQRTVQRVYENLITTGFEEQNIAIFDPAHVKQTAEKVDEPLNKALIQQWVQTTLASRMLTSPAPVYIVMVNHGSPDEFHIFNSFNAANNIITPADLDTWLGAYAANLGTGDAANRAKEQPVVVVVGSCYSGSFLPVVGNAPGELPRRIVIASADSAEESYKGPVESDSARDGELFVSQLFGQLGLGKDLKQAFDEASETMRIYTANKDGNGGRSLTLYSDDAAQHALLDDDGDGVGTHNLLEIPGDGEDGFVASTLRLGFGPEQNAAHIAFVAVTPSYRLAAQESAPTLTADIDFGEPGSTWVEVKPPTFAADQSASTEQKELGNFTQISPDNLGGKALQTHTWSAARMSPVSFTTPGRYEILYFAKNASGELARLARSFVYRAPATPNVAPNNFALVLPEDNATVNESALFFWDVVSDNDTDESAITYSLMLEPSDWPGNSGGASPYPTILLEGLTKPYYQFQAPVSTASPQDLADGVTYNWRVTAWDEYGNATTASNAPRTVTVEGDTNPVNPGAITVRLIDHATRNIIEGATITLDGNANRFVESRGAHYVGNLDSGQLYTIAITSAPGYSTLPGPQTPFLYPGALVEIEFRLSKDTPLLNVTPRFVTVDFAAGTQAINVSNGGTGTLHWSASVTSGNTWLNISTVKLNGDGTIHVDYAENTETSSREGTIVVTNQDDSSDTATITVAQEPAPFPPVLNVSKTQVNVGAAVGSTNVTVANAGGGTLNWTANVTSGGAWLSMSTAKVTGNGTIQINYAENTVTSPRNGTLLVTNSDDPVDTITITVTQAAGAVPPALSVSRTQVNVGAAVGSTNVTVANAGGGTLNWTASVTSGNAWLSMSTAKVTGNGTIQINYAENTVTSPRNGTLLVINADDPVDTITITVTQAAADNPPVLEATPTNISVGSPASSGSIDVTNTGGGNLQWQVGVVNGGDWISLTSDNGTNTGSVGFACTANTTSSPRTGTIRISVTSHTLDPVDVTITQGAKGNINGDTAVNALDIQLVINAALGINIGALSGDVNNDGGTDALDIQLVINAALGITNR